MSIFAVINNVVSKYLKIQISTDDINIFSGCLVIIARQKAKAIRAVLGITWFLLQFSIFFRWNSRTLDMRSPSTFSTSHNWMISHHCPVTSFTFFWARMNCYTSTEQEFSMLEASCWVIVAVNPRTDKTDPFSQSSFLYVASTISSSDPNLRIQFKCFWWTSQ